MASTGESVSYAEYEARTNRLAHLLRDRGLGRLDHYAIFMENNDRYLEACGAGERAGLYYTCVNSFLTAPELAYILNNSSSKLLITSRACRDVALEAARDCPGLTSGLIVDGTGDDGILADFEEATRAFPGTPIGDESLGTAMLYSSGTTGRPKGILRPLPDVPPGDMLPVGSFSIRLNIVGTSWLCVTRYCSTSRRYCPGSNFSMMITVPPWRMARLTAACGAE